MVDIEGSSVVAAAVSFGVGWHAGHVAVIDYTDPHINVTERCSRPTRRHHLDASPTTLLALSDRRPTVTAEIAHVLARRLRCLGPWVRIG